MRRPLSGLEKAFCLSDPPVPLNFALIAQFTGEPEDLAFRTALTSLRKHYHPAALRLGGHEGGEAYFESAGVPDFPLRVIENARDGDWRLVAAEELGEIFDLTKGPLVRAVLLKRCGDSGPEAEIILTFHHGVADGMSAVQFLRDLMRLLEDSRSELQAMPLSADLIGLIPATAKNSWSVKGQVLGLKGVLWLLERCRRVGLRLFPADRQIEGRLPWRHFFLASRCLTETRTALLVDRCREEQTSVHAAICAAWLRARLQINPPILCWKRNISSAIDLRDRLGIGGAFGVYMSTTTTVVNCQRDIEFWSMARQIKNRLDKQIHTGRAYHWILTLMSVTNLSSHLLQNAVSAFAMQPFGCDLSMTNLGRLSIRPEAGSLRLKAIYGPAVNTSEGDLTVGVATACDRLTMVFTSRAFVINPIDAEKVADRAEAILDDAIRL
jgi:NRPS condensation-like uncharacterized protein